jgi:cell division initiation protein
VPVNISPLDIRKHEFKKSLRGYDTDEVSVFLDMISADLETLVHENSTLKEQIADINKQLKKYLEIESILQKTLLTAEKVREDTIENAKKEADIIIREAQVRASSTVEEGRSELSRLKKVVTELKVHKDTYLAKLTALVNAQLELYKEYTFDEERIIKTSTTSEERDT